MPSTRKPARTPPVTREVTADLVRQALASIPPDLSHDDRMRIFAAAWDGIGDAAQHLVLEWAAGRSKPDAQEDLATWRSVRKPGKIKVGTLFFRAKKHGFRMPAPGAAGAVVDPVQAERARLDRERRQAEQEAEYRARADGTAIAARRQWDQALQTGESPYLKRKGVQAHGVRFWPDGTLIVPMRNAAGELMNLQRIAPTKAADGSDKRYLPGGRKSGLWHLLGELQGAVLLLLAEGYATAASLHEATGHPVAVAFDAGNLPNVARALRSLHPALPLLVCGDDDHETARRTGTNPGREKAATAARAAAEDGAAAAAIFPSFADPARRSDFNDLALEQGHQAVAAIVLPACEALLAGELAPPGRRARQASKPAPGDANSGADEPERQAEASGPPEGPPAAPPAPSPPGGSEPPAGGRDPFELDDRGVWYIGRDRDGSDKPPKWLCAPLLVSARTRADDANGWGYLLQFADPDGNAKVWAMPSALLSGEGGEWAARLRDMGLTMAPGTATRNLVAQYIDTRHPEERVTCTDRVGWHGRVYVLPSGSIGESDDGRRYVFQSESGMEDTFRRHGDLADWRREVAARAEGNTRLVFALSCAFAGPMLRLAGMESGGFHFRGTSSMGKTTALRVAASVWGRPAFMQQWRTTDNALEATAVQHSDCTLILDEFSQLDPRVAGECAYMLSNEQEKGRNTRGGLNRKRRTWRLLFLSSGEVSLADHMAEGGRRIQAGMEVRMADVPLDAGAGMGGLEELHDHESPADLAEAITRAAARFYGTAGRAWLEWACNHHARLPDMLQKMVEQYRADFVPEAASEQVRRVGARFALVAAAGELAGSAGITGWAPGHAVHAARACFNAWLGARGHLDNGEEVKMLREVRAFLEKNGDALFTWTHRATDDHKAATPLRAGFKRLVDAEGKPLKIDAATDYVDKLSSEESSERRLALVEFLVLPESFRRDVCRGLDHAAVAQLLRRRGHLVHQSDRLTTKQRLPGMGLASCYHIKPSIFGDTLL